MHRLRPDLVLSERYQLTRHIASGGMGQVWEGTDSVLRRRVAIKIMHPHTQAEFVLVERFREEARFGAQLVHRHIVTVHDFGEHEGLVYLVMEIVDGPTLADLLVSRGVFDPDAVRAILTELAEALDLAHAQGIIHRDIKPANVLVAPDGSVKLMDFGIARSIDGSDLTSTGQVLGTAHYLSPEQAMGTAVGPATDVYAIGILAHEMLTGSKPFERGTPIATALAHVQEPPPPLPDETPADLVAAVTACLAKDPDQRPTCAQLVRLLAPRDPQATEPGPSPRRAIR